MSQLEDMLGRKLSPTARASVANLNELDPQLLAEAKALATKSPPAAVLFLRYHVVRAVEAPDFCEQVLLGSADAATWGIHDRLCVRDADGAALLLFRVDEAIDALAAIAGERWYRWPPPAELSYFGVPGAPGVLVRNTRYWWERPPGVEDVIVRGPLEAVDARDVATAMRRWLGSRIAWAAKDYVAQPGATVSGIFASMGGDATTASADARIAAEALIREMQRPEAAPTVAPGFRGPSEWYAGR